MQRDLIDTRLAALTEERQKAHDELTAMRQRTQYLEAMLLRLDGAITVLQEVLTVLEDVLKTDEGV